MWFFSDFAANSNHLKKKEIPNFQCVPIWLSFMWAFFRLAAACSIIRTGSATQSSLSVQYYWVNAVALKCNYSLFMCAFHIFPMDWCASKRRMSSEHIVNSWMRCVFAWIQTDYSYSENRILFINRRQKILIYVNSITFAHICSAERESNKYVCVAVCILCY